jgi:hypothetical protein
MSNLAIQYVSPDRLRPYPGNARSHSRKQLKLIADSIKRFGFTNPILVTDDFEVIAGHGRLAAAKSLAMQLVPVVALSSLSEADKKGLRIADNRIAELSNWDRDILAIEYQGLQDLHFDDPEVTGFSLGAIDLILDEAAEKKPVEPGPEDNVPAVVARRFRDRAISGSWGPIVCCAGMPAAKLITCGRPCASAARNLNKFASPAMTIAIIELASNHCIPSSCFDRVRPCVRQNDGTLLVLVGSRF